jgi:hypothetical protein
MRQLEGAPLEQLCHHHPVHAYCGRGAAESSAPALKRLNHHEFVDTLHRSANRGHELCVFIVSDEHRPMAPAVLASSHLTCTPRRSNITNVERTAALQEIVFLYNDVVAHTHK